MQKLTLFLTLIFFILQKSIIFSQKNNELGKVTGLEIPRFVSLKKSKTFLRRGPGKSYKIDWILERNSYPLKIIAEHNHWRQVIDFQGDEGWVYFRLLSGKRTIIVKKDNILLKKTSEKNSNPIAILKYGGIGELIDNNNEVCNVRFKDLTGWISKDDIWGC